MNIAKEKGMADPGYKFLSPHNVWCMGKLMYDLLTLAWPFSLDENMENTTEARYYGEYNEHTIPEIKTNRKPEYSTLIRDLIRECLHIKIAKRPTPEQIFERTQRGLEAVVRSREGETGDRNGPRLYYMGNEINHMPLGDAGLDFSHEDWAAVKKEFFVNPLWQPLLSGRWTDAVSSGKLVNRPIEEGGPKRKRRPVQGNVKPDSRPLNEGRNNRGVIWKLRSSSVDREQVEDDEEKQRRQREDNQDEVARPSKNDAAEAVDDANMEPTLSQQANALLDALEEEMEHPRLPLEEAPPTTANAPTESSNVHARPPSNQPQPPLGQQPQAPPSQQPRRPKNRRRVMGISIDEDFQEATGRVVKGHNLRRRRG